MLYYKQFSVVISMQCVLSFSYNSTNVRNSITQFQYLGNYTTERVKTRVIELLYSWSQGLKHEPKILEAYSMLRKQGIVKQDPTHVQKVGFIIHLQLHYFVDYIMYYSNFIIYYLLSSLLILTPV